MLTLTLCDIASQRYESLRHVGTLQREVLSDVTVTILDSDEDLCEVTYLAGTSEYVSSGVVDTLIELLIEEVPVCNL